jgi:hypothetical protein
MIYCVLATGMHLGMPFGGADVNSMTYNPYTTTPVNPNDNVWDQRKTQTQNDLAEQHNRWK